MCSANSCAIVPGHQWYHLRLLLISPVCYNWFYNQPVFLTMKRATKVRLYPTDEQAAFLNAQFG
ncbi:MAG: helix-turn-helix domain-containing protein, partial [Shewanella sp.]|uniref:helix-turn-helix domain-containing protein n=1 Tax=Shewanella sp. TaxID=50422 RepID=UPI003F390184